MSQRQDLLNAARLVEEWWLEEGKHAFKGAPYCMFALRQALARETIPQDDTKEEHF